MSRPVLQRTARTYKRHVEDLTRLRTAVVIDESLKPSEKTELTSAIDSLITLVAPLTTEERDPP